MSSGVLIYLEAMAYFVFGLFLVFECICKVLLADNLFVDMAGVFEYDLELKEKGEHRKFLTQTASFKQVSTENSPKFLDSTETFVVDLVLFIQIYVTYIQQ